MYVLGNLCLVALYPMEPEEVAEDGSSDNFHNHAPNVPHLLHTLAVVLCLSFFYSMLITPMWPASSRSYLRISGLAFDSITICMKAQILMIRSFAGRAHLYK